MEESVLGPLGMLVSVAMAALAAAYFDRRTRSSGLLPPAFGSAGGGEEQAGAGEPEEAARAGAASQSAGSNARRLAGIALLGAVFWLGIFLPAASLGGPEPDLSRLEIPQLFLLHGILLLTLALWYVLGYAGRGAGPDAAFGRQFGLVSPAIAKDVGIGLAAGVAAWVAVLLVLILLAALIWALGGEEAVPKEAPALIPWIAALPIGVRLALSASAGFAEELFFRGFLQPRAGIAFSTVLFVLAHASYGQPLMLVGVTLLSLAFAGLVRWRQNIWAAVVAHAVFDVLQLTVVIPKALQFLEGSGGVPV